MFPLTESPVSGFFCKRKLNIGSSLNIEKVKNRPIAVLLVCYSVVTGITLPNVALVLGIRTRMTFVQL